MRRDITPEDLALYAMQLLDEDETYTVSQFLATSPEARQELALIRGDLATYALTAPMHTPPAMARQRLLKQVMRERKPAATPASIQAFAEAPRNTFAPDNFGAAALAAESFPADTFTPSRAFASESAIDRLPEPSRSTEFSAFAVPPEPQLLRSFGASPSSSYHDEEEAAPRRTSPAAWIFGGVGWVAAAALGVFAVTQFKDADQLRSTVRTQTSALNIANSSAERAQLVLDTLTSVSSQRFVLTKTDIKLPPSARVAYLPDRSALFLQASNLDPLPPAKVYELWLIPSGADRTPVPAGTFKPDLSGNAQIVLPQIPKGLTASKFGVTIENDGGADTPTLPIVMVGQ